MRIANPLIVLAALVAAFGVAKIHAGRPGKPAQPSLDLPLDCNIGRDCIVQKLYDHDPGSGRADYMCGTLTTDGHDGIDFRITDPGRYERGVAVEAAASGIVLRTRDGEPDESIKDRGTTGGRDAGNAVLIDHGGGWVSQYSHLRSGSLLVHPGDTVSTGQPIGIVGLSGNTEYPHLHFSVRYLDKSVDPFAPGITTADCSADQPLLGLWSGPVARRLTYQPTALASIGMASSPEGVGNFLETPRIGAPDARFQPMLLWVQIAGAMAGDTVSFQVMQTDGIRVIDHRTRIEKSALVWTGYSGRKAPAGGWQGGRYLGRVMLERGNLAELSGEVTMTIPDQP